MDDDGRQELRRRIEDILAESKAEDYEWDGEGSAPAISFDEALAADRLVELFASLAAPAREVSGDYVRKLLSCMPDDARVRVLGIDAEWDAAPGVKMRARIDTRNPPPTSGG